MEELVASEKLFEACLKLRRDGFNCLSCLTGTDRGDHLEVVYHLFSYARKETRVLKAKISKESPEIQSVSPIWPSADWMERETYDLVGIKFTGHPNLKRILNPDDWAGHPLRKDYKEPEEYQGMSCSREFPCDK
ncbi:MAG: NADH-quinone oxidoreductase subunit C [Pseudomonadota bacterium]